MLPEQAGLSSVLILFFESLYKYCLIHPPHLAHLHSKYIHFSLSIYIPSKKYFLFFESFRVTSWCSGV
ncbi:hypothetical protein Q3G72_023533 [Acer saccharum]|nr:hypothetical protein Q3G72_023533 [Acer saccharum]